jgi:hypothetical protein
MAGSILNLWVQQQRMWGFTEKKCIKQKKNMANRKNTNQTAKKKTKEQNSKTEGNPGFELFWFLC